ncbi:hypothetical protein [Pontibacter brevis]
MKVLPPYSLMVERAKPDTEAFVEGGKEHLPLNLSSSIAQP